MVPIQYYLVLSTTVLCIGTFDPLTRRDAPSLLASVGLMLNAANIDLIVLSYYWDNATGQTFELPTMVFAVAEMAVGIGIILVLYRNFDDVDVTNVITMRW